MFKKIPNLVFSHFGPNLLFIAMILMGIIVPLFSQATVSAQTIQEYGVTDKNDVGAAISSVAWVDAAHILVTFRNGKTLSFIPSSGLRTERLSTEQGYGVRYTTETPYSCTARVEIDINENDDSFTKQEKILESVHVDIDFRPNLDSDCENGNDFSIDAVNPEKSISYFKWNSPNNIGMVDGAENPGNFTKGTTDITIDGVLYEVYLSDREATASSCRDKLILNRATNTIKWYQLGSSDGDPPDEVSTTCGYNEENDEESFPRNNHNWVLSNTPASVAALPPTDPDNPVIPGQENDSEAIKGSCADNDGEFVFFQCAAISLAGDTINELDSKIREALEVKPDLYQDRQTKLAWANFRNIAYILLVPLLLVMIISTALGFSFVDAYTVKRALPRLLVAIIFIALSYEICTAMISFTTDVGRGVQGLIAAPFGGVDNLSLANIFSPSKSGVVGIGAGVLGGIALVTVGAIGLGIIASYLFVAALTIIIIFALLTMREMILLFLVIVAPLAILAWIFPGNDKLWKIWWGSFSKLLMLFPLIAGLLMVGRAFALLLQSVPVADAAVGIGPLDGVLVTFAKLIAYIGPFFFIPAAFKFAGGAFGNLAGMVNNKSKGLFDRQSKYRGNKRKENYHALKEGKRFKNAREGGLLMKLNETGEAATKLNQIGANPTNWKRNLNQRMNTSANVEAQQFAEKNESFQQFKGDDDMLKAAQHREEGQIRAALIRHGGARFRDDVKAQDDAVALIRQAQEGASNATFQRARVGALPATGTAYQYAYNKDGTIMEEEILDANGIGTGQYKKVEREDGVDLNQMMKDLNTVYGDDRAGAGAALARARSASVQSGQVIAGKAGYATMATQMGRLYTNKNVEGAQKDLLEADVRNIVVQDAIDSSTPGEALYGKPASAAAYAGGWADRMEEIVVQMKAGNPKVSFDDLARAVASTGGLLDAAGQASPQNAREMERLLQSKNIDLSGLTIPGMDPGTTTLSVRQLIENQAFSSEAHRGMRRDYGNAAVADMNGRVAAAAGLAQVQQQPGQIPGQRS